MQRAVSLFYVFEKLWVSEGVCPVSSPALLLEEQAHVVPGEVRYAAAPQWLRDPQQLPDMRRDDLQQVHDTLWDLHPSMVLLCLSVGC